MVRLEDAGTTPAPEPAMSATTLIQTAHPARFAGLVLAAGVGIAAFAPDRPVVPGPALRLVASRREAA